MFTKNEIQNILFIDIETVSTEAEYNSMDERMQLLWDKKSRRYQTSEKEAPDVLFKEKAGIHAEFGKIVCISCGYIRFGEPDAKATIKVKSFAGEDEEKLLREFAETLNQFTARAGRRICGHNGKEFDFPYLGRRYLIHGIPLPYVLQVQNKKPWETAFVDTMQMWKFGDFKSYTSLDLLAAIFGVPSSKDDIDGSQVGKVFWEEKDVERIQVYCEKDVWVTALVLMRMCGVSEELEIVR